MRSAIVLAAGKGTRMKSGLNKVMHQVCNKPMIQHVVDVLKKADVENIVVVVGHQAESIQAHLQDSVRYVEQREQLGTGHAILQAVPLLQEVEGDVLVICGDTPLFTLETIETMFETNRTHAMSVLTAQLEDGKRYGRIVRNAQGLVERIVEAKDADEATLALTEINTGLYCFKADALRAYITHIDNNNAQKEYYLTDLIEIFNENQLSVEGVVVKDFNEALGVNDRLDLAHANELMRKRINRHHMLNGVTLVSPDQTYIDADVIIGTDTIIEPNVTIKGKSVIGSHCHITNGSIIDHAVLGNHITVESSKIINSVIHDGTTIGPFAHLREHTTVHANARIGNFVEFKKTNFGEGSKCAHLTYLGDSEFGKAVNVGCGVVTVNYDGKNKFKTIVGDGAFIGSNVNIIAPVSIGSKAVCAAGSTITKDVPDGDMGIARCRQENKEGFGSKYLKK
ncbi:MAG: bifunctional UDP-N-acetylglucosamine diphosphorylase/glucosamine-1-phosphate N-acetyltransferase GlmU [Erysipelotrichaceae bacterium]